MTSTEAPVPPGVGKGELAPSPLPMLNPIDQTKLNVGLYPYVPMQSWFQDAITEAWGKLTPKPMYSLNFVDYDAYNDDPPDGLEVFAFDTIRIKDLEGKLFDFVWDKPQLDQFFGWTKWGLWSDGTPLTVHALPYLGCTSILIYRKNDPNLKDLQAADLKWDKFKTAITPSDNKHPIPPAGKGLLVDLTGGTTLVCLYLQSIMQQTGRFPQPATIPKSKSEFDKTAIDSLKTIVGIAGDKQAKYVDTSGYTRLTMFLKGYGQAYVGFPEHFYFFPSGEVDNYRFYPLPLAMSTGVSTLPMYADAIGVNKKVDTKKKDEAIKLVQLIAGKALLDTVLTQRDPYDGNPQFLTPVRQTSLDDLITKFTKYPNVYPNVKVWVGKDAKPQPMAFRLEAGYRDKIKKIKADLQTAIFGKPLAEAFDEPKFGPEYARTPGGLWRRP